MPGLSIFKMITIGLLPSSLKKLYYRLRGAKIGKGVSIGLFSILNCKRIIIEDYARIGLLCQITADDFKLGRYSQLKMMVVIDTKRVVIGEEVIIMEQTFLGGMKTDKSSLEIGDRCKIFPNCVINPTLPIKIGNDVGIGGANYLFTHGSWQSILEGFPVTFGPITIEDGVWLPWRVLVLPNVHIGKNATIGAGALINRDVPERSLAVGVPAKVVRKGEEHIKDLNPSDRKSILLNIINDLIAYFNSERWQISQSPIQNSILVASFTSPRKRFFSKKRGEIRVILDDIDNSWNTCRDRTCLISLVPINSEARTLVEKGNGMWFDLVEKACGGKRTFENLEVRNFLSRYGIRLKYMSS